MQTNLINDHNAFNYASAKLTPLFDSTSWISSDDTLELRNNNNNNNNFNHLNTKNLIQSSQIHLKHSMSDDEVAYNATIHDDRKKEDGNHTIYPLFNGLKESVSANITKRKRKKGRSNSAIISGNNDKYHHKWKTLKREYKLQSDKLKVYQDTMNDIQDEREEFETNLQKEYELKILHLETKYHLEKGEKNTLQFENEKLRQQLFLKDRELQHLQSITSGYSTAAGSVNDGSPTHAQIPIIPLIPNQSAHTNQTVITHHSRNSQISQISQMSQISQQSPKSRKSRKSRKSLKPTRSPDPSMTGSEPSSSSNTDTNSSESDSDNDSSDTDDDDDSYSSSNTASTVTTISDDDDEKEEKVSKNEGDKYTKDVINTVSKRVKKRTSKNKKISNKLNQKIAEQQPKGFWATLWSLFGPPELMCSCSDDNKK